MLRFVLTSSIILYSATFFSCAGVEVEPEPSVMVASSHDGCGEGAADVVLERGGKAVSPAAYGRRGCSNAFVADIPGVYETKFDPSQRFTVQFLGDYDLIQTPNDCESTWLKVSLWKKTNGRYVKVRELQRDGTYALIRVVPFGGTVSGPGCNAISDIGFYDELAGGGDFRVVASAGYRSRLFPVGIKHNEPNGELCPAAEEFGEPCEFDPHPQCTHGVAGLLHVGMKGCSSSGCLRDPARDYPICNRCGGDCGGCPDDRCSADRQCAPGSTCNQGTGRCETLSACLWRTRTGSSDSYCWNPSPAGDFGIDRYAPCEELRCDPDAAIAAPNHDACVDAAPDLTLRGNDGTVQSPDAYGNPGCTGTYVIDIPGVVDPQIDPNQHFHVAATDYGRYTEAACSTTWLKTSLFRRQDGKYVKVREIQTQPSWKEGSPGDAYRCFLGDANFGRSDLAGGGDFRVVATAAYGCGLLPVRFTHSHFPEPTVVP